MKRFLFLGLLLVLFSTPIFALSDANLVAYYKFDETTGTTAIDWKGFDQNGTNTNVVLGEIGKIGYGYNYTTGPSSVTDLGSEIPFDVDRFALGVWIKTNISSTRHPVAGHNLMANGGNNRDGWRLWVGVDFPGKAQFQINTSANISGITNVYSDGNVADGLWHFIVIDYNGTHARMFVDGIQQGGNVLSAPPRDVSGQKTSIGNIYYQGSYEESFRGVIDEVSFWNKSLTQTEINELYNSGNGLTYPFDINRIYADFDYSINNLQVDLNDTSRVNGDAVIDSWEWLIDDVSVSTDQNYSFTGTEATDYNVCLIIQDTVLSLEDSTCQTISIGDLTPPTTTFSSSQITGTTDQNITLTCTDNNSGCQYINFRINNGDWNYYLIGDNPLTIIYSGAGVNTIQYFSTDNSDNNETIKTSNFTTYGQGKFTFYDENSLNLLNSINYTITPSINGVSSGTTDGNTLDLNLQGITTGTYTFTFTKTGYSTRSYAIDLTQYSEIDINFALIPESLSKEIQFRFYKPDQTTSYNNVYITASKNPQGFVLSRLKTDATGIVTFNLDQNSTGITFDMNNGENTYNSVILTINKPKDEQTLIDINANWSYDISGLASYTDSNATTATKVFAIYSNTVNTYSVLIGSKSTVPPYTTRKYDIQVFGDTNTYTLQPYLINTTDSIQTTIFTINPYTNQAISDVTIKIYRTLPLTGRTLIEQTITDSKGQSIVYLVLNQTYSFEISVGTTTIRTETYTITGTSSTIYFKVDPGYDLSTTPMQTSIYSFWTPGKNSLNKADRNISANVIYGTNRNSVTVSSIILNCYNNLDLNQVLLFQDSFSSPTMNFIQTYDFNLTTKTINSVTFDTNYSITCNIYTTLSDGNLIVSRQTYTMNNDDPQTNLGMDLRPFFGCSPTTDPNLPCPSMILAAVFITMMVITGIMIESGFTQPEFAGILFLIGLGFFTFFTWIPPVLYVIMLVIGLLIYVALGVRRI